MSNMEFLIVNIYPVMKIRMNLFNSNKKKTTAINLII